MNPILQMNFAFIKKNNVNVLNIGKSCVIDTLLVLLLMERLSFYSQGNNIQEKESPLWEARLTC